MIDRFPYIKTLLQIQARRLFKKHPFTVVDVGAYLGDSCVHLAKSFRPATVYAVEPFPENVKVLAKRAQTITNITVKSVAITDHTGMAELGGRLDGKPYLSASLNKGGETVEVYCQTLPDLCRTCEIKQIDMLLLNCEGAEYSIFSHKPTRTLIDRITVIDLSMHGKGFLYNQEKYAVQRKEINDFLIGRGFELIYGDQVNTITAATGHIRQVWTKR